MSKPKFVLFGGKKQPIKLLIEVEDIRGQHDTEIGFMLAVADSIEADLGVVGKISVVK